MHVVWISFTNEKDLPDTALNWKKESPYKTLNDDLKQSITHKRKRAAQNILLKK